MSTTTSALSTPAALAPGHRRRLRWIGWIAALLVIAAVSFFGYMAWRMSYVPSNLNLSTTVNSEQELFRAAYAPQDGAIAINKIHSWTLHVERPDGALVENAQITVDGDMPQHGHGLPTQPQVTQYLGNGDYLVEGMKFQMPGWWVVAFTVTDAGQTDTATFNLMLQ